MRLTLSLLLVLILQAGIAQVIFTEYVEGSGHNKAVEITNISADALNLGECRIEVYFNGAKNPEQAFDLNSSLAPGESHVFFHQEQGGNYADGFVAAARSGASSQSGGFGWFNGNDAIVLRCIGEVVDSLGQVGDDGYWGKDVTLRRSSGPADTDPRDDWAPGPGGWAELGRNTFDGLGQP